jgi:hypothetical protein
MSDVGLLRWLAGCGGDVELCVSYMSAVLGIASPAECREMLERVIPKEKRDGEH